MGFAQIAELTHRDGGRLRAAAPAQRAGCPRGDRHRARLPRRAVGRGRVDRGRRARRRSTRRRWSSACAAWCAPRTAEQEMARNGGVDEPSRTAVHAATRGRRARPASSRGPRRGGADAGRPRAHGVRRARRSRRAARQRSGPGGTRAVPGPRDQAWVASDHEDETIVQNLSSVSEVASVTVADISRTRGGGRSARRRARARARARRRRGEPGPEPVALAPSRRRAREAGRVAVQGDPDRPRRRRAPRRADALDGRARHPPHRGRGTDRETRGRRACSRPCRSSPAARRRCRRWSCRSG